MTTQEFGKRVKERRLELGMSQLDLAVKIGYKDKSTVAKIESGNRDLPRSKIVEIADALSVTPQYLLGWESKNAAPKRTARQQEFLDLFNKLNTDQQKKIITQMKGFLEAR